MRKSPSQIFERRDRRQEVARVREAVRADRAELRQPEAARRSFRRCSRAPRRPAAPTRNLMPRGITQISPGATSRIPSSVAKHAAPQLRHDQQFAVGVVEEALLHGWRWRRRREWPRRSASPDRRCRRWSRCRRRNRWLRRECGNGSQRSWLGGVGTSSNGPLRIMPELAIFDTACASPRANAIRPRAPVHGARCGERAAAELLGVESEGRLLRRVLANGESAGYGLRREFVPEAGLVMQFVGRHTLLALGLRD